PCWRATASCPGSWPTGATGWSSPTASFCWVCSPPSSWSSFAARPSAALALSQRGMVRHWYDNQEPGWQIKMLINLTGGITTGVVMFVIAGTKFVHGAWVVVLLIPLLSIAFNGVKKHYEFVPRELSREGFRPKVPAGHTVVVLISGVHRGVLEALQYAKALSPNVTAVSVEIDHASTERVRERWRQWGMGIPLTVLKSNYRSVVRPLLDYLDEVMERN